jgi:hypothetical protein
MSAAAVAVILPGTGASVELACSAVRPCCHAGGGGAAGVAAGAAGAGAVVVIDWHATSVSALAARVILASIGVSSLCAVACVGTRSAHPCIAAHYRHGARVSVDPRGASA